MLAFFWWWWLLCVFPSVFCGEVSPFLAGEVWRGMLTSCQQSGYHLKRSYRYFPVDLSVESVEPELVVRFVTHFDHSFYELKGSYDSLKRHFFLKATRGKVSRGWEPCDVEGYASPDLSTLSGISLCSTKTTCDPGGGEFILKRERTEFVVEGSGDVAVDGVYSSKETYDKKNDETTDIYDGSPIYLQQRKNCRQTHDDDSCKGAYAMTHEVLGQYGFWRIQKANTIGSKTPTIRYVVCSEDVYPPETGWRPTHLQFAPPPTVRLNLQSIYDLRNNYNKNYRKPPNDTFFERRFFLITLIGGIFFWAAIFLLFRLRLKKKKAKIEKNKKAALDSSEPPL